MSVVLRCPTCGTSQVHRGECEACSEGEVRYFCTNHEQGLWLDRPVCSRCGAEFGKAPKKPLSTAPPKRPPPAPEVLPPVTSLEDLLGDIADARARTRARPLDDAEELPWTRPPAASRAPGLLAGCLLRAVGLVFFLILAAIILLFMLFGGFAY